MATKQQIDTFINTFVPLVREQCKIHKWGVVSAIVAQAGLESAWGTSSLGGLNRSDSCYNFWGMKWTSTCGCDYKAFTTKEQNKDGSYVTIVSKFRKYPNVNAGIDGYFRFIESYSRYKPVINAKNYVEYATQLKNCGWATSLQYTQNILNTIKKYELYKYDDDNVVVPANKPKIYQEGQTYITNVNLFVRCEPKGEKKLLSELSVNAKLHAYNDGNGYGILKKGTKVTCKGITVAGNQTWMKIPSGYICAINNGTVYIE